MLLTRAEIAKKQTEVRVSCAGGVKVLHEAELTLRCVAVDLALHSFPFLSSSFADPARENCSEAEIQSFHLLSSLKTLLVQHRAGVYCGFDETKCLQKNKKNSF